MLTSRAVSSTPVVVSLGTLWIIIYYPWNRKREAKWQMRMATGVSGRIKTMQKWVHMTSLTTAYPQSSCELAQSSARTLVNATICHAQLQPAIGILLL